MFSTIQNNNIIKSSNLLNKVYMEIIRLEDSNNYIFDKICEWIYNLKHFLNKYLYNFCSTSFTNI